MDATSLDRRLTLPLLTLYGLGTMVGAGFYALVGKVAGEAGMATPLAFLISAALAGLSALSYGELASRYPSSAGESVYAQEAFGKAWLATGVGWMVIATGLVSASTLANAFALFLTDLAPVPIPVGILGVLALLGGVACWGIGESVWAAVVITVIEVGGLVYVLAVNLDAWPTIATRLPELMLPSSPELGAGVLSGAFLAFYAFVGFEDMVNLAEEVVDVEHTMPRAILLALAITTVLYVLVSSVALVTVDTAALTEAHTPLALMAGVQGGTGAVLVTIVSLFAGVNGALMQIVMASRVAYGMARRGLAPAVLGRVHPRTRTPVEATVAATVVVAVLALTVPLVSLAKVTATILLLVFALVDTALVAIKRRGGSVPDHVVQVPLWVPALGAVGSVAIVALQLVA